MAFSIQATSELFDRMACDEPALKGLIEIGTYKEELLLSLLVWTRADYLRHWDEALHQILVADTSCLVTSMRDLAVSDFINRWLLYRDGESVLFQNQVLFAADVQQELVGSSSWRSVPTRRTHTNDGHQISEWNVLLSDIQLFLASRGPTDCKPELGRSERI